MHHQNAQTHIYKMGVVLFKQDVFHIKSRMGTCYVIFIVSIIIFSISLWSGNKFSSPLSLLSPTFLLVCGVLGRSETEY